MQDDFLDNVALALPNYLTVEDKKKLLGQLRQFPDCTDYYGAIPGETEPVQGDGWRGLCAIDFASGARELVLGLVVSNSCDIARARDPDQDQRLLFAPVLDLDRYLNFLRESGKAHDYIVSTSHNIRCQYTDRLFYLPAMHGLFGESVVPLDAIHSQPLSSIDPNAISRVWTLSTYGWYMLLFKLSIHFTRMSEAVSRASYDDRQTKNERDPGGAAAAAPLNPNTP